MDFSAYFEPFDISIFPDFQPLPRTLGDRTRAVSSLDEILEHNIRLVILGAGEGRNAINNEECAEGCDHIRRELFALYPDECEPVLGDLGNLVLGYTPEDTYFKLQEVIEVLLKNNIIPIILGGGNELAYLQYRAYQKLEQMVTMVSVDAGFDFGHLAGPFNSRSYTERIITDEPTHLYSYTNIGYQAYLTDPSIIQMMQKLNFDLHRLAHARGSIDSIEPSIRNADLLSFDIGAIRHCDAPGNRNSSPNGLQADEACKVMKYAGMSDKLSSVGLYEYNPSCDTHGTTSRLAAQMLWCFIEGVYNRKGDYPFGDTGTYQKFIIENEQLQDPLVFYKSDRSGRWWIEAPRAGSHSFQAYRQRLVPCNYSDFEMANRNEVPETWWSQLLKN